MTSVLKVFCVALVFALASCCLSYTYASAQGRSRTSQVPVKDERRSADAARHSQEAAKVFREVMGTPDRALPRELLDKAEAVAVFPGVKKAGFIVGGRYGQGVISRRIQGGWSAPAFFNLGGADFGAQIGAEKTDFVLLFMNESAVGSLLQDKVELGGELSVAAGPVGRTAAATTDAQLKAGILTYSRSKGAFIGAVIKGANISPDNDLNEAVYGVKAKEVLENGTAINMAQMPNVVRIFPRTLSRYSSR